MFPSDAFGGVSASQAAREVTIHWGGGESAATDIDMKKMIFRRRGWVREFFSKNLLVAGDSIGIEKLPDDSYRVFPIRGEPGRNA